MADLKLCIFCERETQDNSFLPLCSECQYARKKESDIKKIREEQKEQYAKEQVLKELDNLIVEIESKFSITDSCHDVFCYLRAKKIRYEVNNKND